MTAPFDWAGLAAKVHDLVVSRGNVVTAGELIRTRIEAAFVPVQSYTSLVAESDQAAARAEAAEALAGRYAVALIEIANMPFPGAPDIRMRRIARQALGG
ncbi:hypothetical protein UFOVP5_18 [uncultured Caudovirales phage]|uniref:Uncharacterized protein n=1 Tax=uncultured Caudovirales phage TaxID=2100421 RepID=A0A6J5KH35_9CAUD|nr:hypothetical protein UFOVP5_18 [uncultured Caudovirales phage]